MALRRYGLALAAFCICAVAAAPAFSTDWPLGRYDTSCTGYTPESISAPLAVAWEFNSLRAGKNTAAPIVADGTVFFCSTDRMLALDAETGKLKWSFPADQGLNGAIKASPAYSDGTVYFGASDGNLYAVSAADGTLNWSFPTNGSIRSAPIVYEGSVYFGSDNNSLYAIRASNGELAWRGPFVTKDDIASSPAIADGYAVFACADAMLYMASASSGSQRWEYRLPTSAVRSAPVVSDDVVHIAAGNTLYAVGRKAGRLRWFTPFKSDIASGPTIARNTDPVVEGTIAPPSKSIIYVVTRNNKLYALKSNGRPKWDNPVDLPYICNTAPTAVGDLVVVGGERGALCAYSALDGKLVWQYNILPSQFKGPGNYTAISAVTTVADKRLYVVTDDGTLHCFDSETPDNTAPEAFRLLPARGTAMSGSPPIDLSAIVYDMGCGVNPSTVELAIDGTAVTHEFDVTSSTVSYHTSDSSVPRVLPDGRHEITLRAKDWRGNAMVTSWSFIVDNKLRPPAPPKTAAKPKPGASPQPNTSVEAPVPPSPEASAGNVPSDGRFRRGGFGRGHIDRDGGPPPPPPPPVMPGAAGDTAVPQPAAPGP
jgi:eukaryotic-like serine/threonine-protein kinase